jgi:glycosyltransferase involved in cell wall biosynthesis
MMTFLAGLLVLVALVWATRHIAISRADRLLPPLHSGLYPQSNGDVLPRISVLVAAKDEEQNIEACLRSWLTQDYPDFEVICIDDRSSDGTAVIIDAIAADDARVRALHVTELMPGWFGKNNAMRVGVERASGDWLCFSDADCLQTSPRSLTVAMRHAQETRVDFLSVLPNLEMHGLWERIIQPACGGIMMLWFNPLKVNDPRRPNAYANGAFMLLSRAAYDAIGGHEPVKTEVNEDMHMARRAKEAGLRLRVVSNADLYRVRMYNSFAQAWRGWSRIFYGCFGTLRRLVVSLVLSLLPWLALVGGLLARGLGFAADRTGDVLLVSAAAACALQMSVLFRFYRICRVNPLLAPTYPIGALLAAGMLISAIRRLGGRSTTTWRGTIYRGDRVEAAAVARK